MPPLSKLDHALAAREASGTADFHIHTSAMELGSWHGSPTVSMIGSSNVRDLRGDTIMDSALKDMAMVERGMVIWLNHDYSLPNSLFGSLVESPRVEYTAGIADLRLLSDVEMGNDAAAKTLKYIEKGRKLGCSIGMRVDEARIDEDLYEKSGQVAMLIDRVTPVEWSVVGVPCNQRSWVENATKGYFAKSLAANDPSVIDLRVASIVRALFPREYREMTKSVDTFDGRLSEVAPASKPAKRIIFDTASGVWKLNTKNGREDITREEVEALLLASATETPPATPSPAAPADATPPTPLTPDESAAIAQQLRAAGVPQGEPKEETDDASADDDDETDDDDDAGAGDHLLTPLDVEGDADPDVEGERNSRLPLEGDLTLDPLPPLDDATRVLSQNAAPKRKPRKPMKPTKERPQYNYKGVPHPRFTTPFTKDANGNEVPGAITLTIVPSLLSVTMDGVEQIDADEALTREASYKASVAVLTAEQRAQYEMLLAENPLTDESLAKAYKRELKQAKTFKRYQQRLEKYAAAQTAITAGPDGELDTTRAKKFSLLMALAGDLDIAVKAKARAISTPDPKDTQWLAASVLVKQAARILRKAGRSVSEENMTQLQLAHDALATVTDGYVCKGGATDGTDMRSAAAADGAVPTVSRAHLLTQSAEVVALINGLVTSLQGLDLGETKATILAQATQLQHETEVGFKRLEALEQRISGLTTLSMGRPTSFVGRSVDLDPAAATWMEMATSGAAADGMTRVPGQDHGPVGTHLVRATRKGYPTTLRHWPAGVTGASAERPSLEPEQMTLMSYADIMRYTSNEEVSVPVVG